MLLKTKNMYYFFLSSNDMQSIRKFQKEPLKNHSSKSSCEERFIWDVNKLAKWQNKWNQTKEYKNRKNRRRLIILSYCQIKLEKSAKWRYIAFVFGMRAFVHFIISNLYKNCCIARKKLYSKYFFTPELNRKSKCVHLLWVRWLKRIIFVFFFLKRYF